MDNMQLIKTKRFGTVPCDFYGDKDDIWLTREQIGTALGYAHPRESIKTIHNRYKERLNKFSRRDQIDTPSGKQESVLYNIKGLYEICRWSQQPKANAFMDWAWDTIEKLRRGITVTPDTQHIITETAKAVVSEVVQQLVPVIVNVARNPAPQPGTAASSSISVSETNININNHNRRPRRAHGKISKLDDDLLQKVNQMIFSRTATYADIMDMLAREASMKIFQASICRYAKRVNRMGDTPWTNM